MNRDNKDEEDKKSDNEFYTPREIPRDMSDLESGESAEQGRNQEGQGPTILTPD